MSESIGSGHPYPIIDVIRLAPPERRLLRGDYRDPTPLHDIAPHYTLVFHTDGEYQEKPAQRFSGTEDFLVRSTSIAVVDTGIGRQVMTWLAIPSSNASLGFTLRTIFRCTVARPTVVVERGMTDISARLTEYLRSFTMVRELGSSIAPGNLAGAQRMADATLRALQDAAPVIEPGMSVELSSWEIAVADETAGWARQEFTAEMGEKRRRRDFQSAVQQAKERLWLREMDPDGEDALLFVLQGNETGSDWAAEENVRKTREARRERSADWRREEAQTILAHYMGPGFAKLSPLEARELIDRLLERALDTDADGSRQARQAPDHTLGTGGRSRQRRIAWHDDETADLDEGPLNDD